MRYIRAPTDLYDQGHGAGRLGQTQEKYKQKYLMRESTQEEPEGTR